MGNLNYKEEKYSKIAHFNKDDIILLITATDVETNATHNKLKPLAGYFEILKIFEGTQTYYLGVLGNYKVAHVQCSMGTSSRDSSIMTVNEALTLFKSKVVIMIGIAFGVDDEKQNIGDVLVSEAILPYNFKRVGKTLTVQRSVDAPASKMLINRFKNLKTTWEYLLPNNKKAEIINTHVLSGEELIDNKEYRDKLLEKFPTAKGGEMEGAGIYSACDGKADWILVKGICDFADGEKGQNKSDRQNIAIESALSACLELFTSETAFKDLGIYPFDENEFDENSDKNFTNDILFDVYDNNKEKYYIKREADKDFVKNINQYGLWICGPTGCGKSNLIFRNLIKNNISYIQINLAPCVGANIESFFIEIFCDLTSKFENEYIKEQPKNFADCNRAILGLLKKYYSQKELILFIEEIPLSNDKEKKEFTEKIFSLIISKAFINELDNVKFVLSSIDDQSKNIQLFQQKILQQIKFIKLNYWQDKEIIELVDLIIDVTKINLPKDLKNELILIAKGSPRFVKKYFRNVFAVNKFDENTLRQMLSETERELSTK